jgi:hypothetical protein
VCTCSKSLRFKHAAPWAREMRGSALCPEAVAKHCNLAWALQGLAHIAWTSARLGVRPSTLLDAVATESASRMSEFTTQNVAILCWSFAKLGHKPPNTFLKAAEEHMKVRSYHLLHLHIATECLQCL